MLGKKREDSGQFAVAFPGHDGGEGPLCQQNGHSKPPSQHVGCRGHPTDVGNRILLATAPRTLQQCPSTGGQALGTAARSKARLYDNKEVQFREGVC